MKHFWTPYAVNDLVTNIGWIIAWLMVLAWVLFA